MIQFILIIILIILFCSLAYFIGYKKGLYQNETDRDYEEELELLMWEDITQILEDMKKRKISQQQEKSEDGHWTMWKN